ncbi:MAG: DUF429 domain-containing protein [Chloroflexota bacterium]|nr:DUF429 domain-containing protein [Chloroflexota bacterium]
MQLQLVFGIDLTSTSAKPSACLGLDNRLELTYFGFISDDHDIISTMKFYSPKVIAIDAPLSLPSGLCCLEENCTCQPKFNRKNRQCDRELIHEGISCYPTSKKSFIKNLIYRGIKLKNELSHLGFEVIEVYPYASKVRLFGKEIPRKNTPQGMVFLKERVADILPSLKQYLSMFNHDLCDAAIAAHTAFLHYQGKADALGSSEEGLIFVPH